MTYAWQVYEGDVRTLIRPLRKHVYGAQAFDAVLCDPPYELGFMGKSWDRTGVAFDKRTWALIRSLCKPGAHLLAFGGTRTAHRLFVAVEDGGFEIRDSLAWLYGSGFPKSLDVSKAIDKAAGAEREVVGVRPGHEEFVGRTDAHSAGARCDGWDRPWKADPEKVKAHHLATAPASPLAKTWAGYGTALKPAYEPIVLARVPLDGTMVENVTKWGCGALAIDDCRIATDWSERPESWKRSGHSKKPDAEKIAAPAGQGIECHPKGRWPANVLLDEEAAALLDAQTGTLTSGSSDGFQGEVTKSVALGAKRNQIRPEVIYADSGGASRFFYTAKASREDRNHGLTHLPKHSPGEMVNRKEGSAAMQSPRTGAGRLSGAQNIHPTVKPTDLLEYLAKLILPPKRATPRRLFVPFAGSGSEMIAALRAGWDEVVGIELEYASLCRERLTHADKSHQAELFG